VLLQLNIFFTPSGGEKKQTIIHKKKRNYNLR